MANLRDVRLRMRTIEQTLKVTRAMDLISTSKLRKGRRTQEDVRPFFTRIQKSVYDILNSAENGGALSVNSEFLGRKKGEVSRTAIVAVTSDKGLAGGYNAGIIRETQELLQKTENPLLVLIGNSGYRYFLNTRSVILENFTFQSRLPEVEDAKEIAEYLVAQYEWGMFDEVVMIYTHMFSAVKIQPVTRHILPLSLERMREDPAPFNYGERANLPFEYEPSAEAVFEKLAPLYIRGIVYGCLVESYASEQSARMSAMSEASKNAETMLAELQISYNRERQAGITQEMTEIVSGSAALR